MTQIRNGVRALGLAMLFGSVSAAQFSSGSDGSDGALTFPANAGTVVFNPATLNLDQDGDGVYHFTTVTVPTGTTVRLSADVLGEGKPVIWLASGLVTIEGTIDLNGQTGAGPTETRVPSVAGAGGFNGGVGATTGNALPAEPGSGPGGGGVQASRSGGGGSFLLSGRIRPINCAPAGATYGNRFLLPLIGGSGGGGGAPATTASGGGGGGAGGGALLVASSAGITLNGTISARGGDGGSRGGGGSGGAIRLMAPEIGGTGSVDVTGGATPNTNDCFGADGVVRLEARRVTLSTITPPSAVFRSRPGPIFLPANAPKVRITQIGSTSVSTVSPTGSLYTPDATINESGPVSLTITANNIPLGTQLQLTIHPEGGTPITVTSTALTGTTATSTATAGPLTIPNGLSRFYVVATWTP